MTDEYKWFDTDTNEYHLKKQKIVKAYVNRSRRDLEKELRQEIIKEYDQNTIERCHWLEDKLADYLERENKIRDILSEDECEDID